MCEWNYKANGAPKEGRHGGSDSSLYMLVQRVIWRLMPWRHGPDCKWMRWVR